MATSGKTGSRAPSPRVSLPSTATEFPRSHQRIANPSDTTNFIDNEFVKSNTAEWIGLHDPATNYLVTRVPQSTNEELRAAVASAQKAFPAWRVTSIIAKQYIMFKFVGLIRANWDRLAASITLEQGKNLKDARGDALRGLQVARDMETRSYREPLGAVAAICPFNFPAMIPLWSIPIATVTGNCLILKPSERDPGAAMILAELAREAGFPKGVLKEDAMVAVLVQAAVDGNTTVTTNRIYAGFSAANQKAVSLSLTSMIPDTPSQVRSLEANFGATFMRRVGLKIDPTNAPKLNLFGWNIGARKLLSGSGPCTALPIVDIISEQDLKKLANVYFSKVDPCYGNAYDAVLCGVSALGALFSQRDTTITELHLVESARSILDLHQISEAPSVDLVTGWVLRVIYMRMTASPHSTWIASSILIHLIEASGLHLEPYDDTVFPQHNLLCDPDIRRRLIGVAQHVNMWTSFDLGLSRVALQSLLLTPLASKSGDYTTELLRLLPVSTNLDPVKTEDDRNLEPSLRQVLSGNHTQPPSVLAQCNLVLCILRRLGPVNFNMTPTLAEQVLALLNDALRSARFLAKDCSPWHHVANVPFHIICMLLVLDTRSSLAMLPEALQTLELVASIYDTDAMKQAHSAARLLIFLHQERRSEDVKILRDVLQTQGQQGVGLMMPPSHFTPTSEESSWLEGLVADMPGLQEFDLGHFF
ncbi:Aldehyde dehydrogenase domain [Fusarium oxysporum f. sp. vasinfectum]|nr:Aldehyde dehydrogenase domain [Fusarium oxysporum f. sp. vasinfectum]